MNSLIAALTVMGIKGYWVSRAELGEEISVSYSQVARIIDKLKSLGVVINKRSNRGRIEYFVEDWGPFNRKWITSRGWAIKFAADRKKDLIELELSKHEKVTPSNT